MPYIAYLPDDKTTQGVVTNKDEVIKILYSEDSIYETD